MAFGQERENNAYVDKLVTINRVAKVVKGGRRFSFSAIIVVGDEGGRVGWGKGKAKEVPEAIRKATDMAKKRMVRVPMRDGRTLHHDMNGYFGGAKVILRPAKPGRGIIAGGPMRAIFEAMGIKDVVAKSLGSNNPYNMIQATFAAFDRLETPRQVAAKRGKKVGDFGRFKATADAPAADAAPEAEAQAEKPAPKKAAAKKPAAKKAAPKKAAAKKDDADVKAEAKAEKEAK